MLLLATGRRPNMEGLGLEAAGVQFSPRGGIDVDAYLRTNVKNIYAAGDVLGGLQFTHLAGWQCFQAVRNALLPGRSPGNPKALPRVTFLDPEIATVGLLEEEARAKHGADVRLHRWDMGATDRAIVDGGHLVDDERLLDGERLIDDGRPVDGGSHGFIKVVALASGKLLGVSIVATRAGEMLAEFVLAMENGLGLSELATTVHAYPTWTSAVQEMASVGAMDRFLESRMGRLALFFSGLSGHEGGAEK